MSYFSRLTDIVTCNLSEILAKETDPAAALKRILAEMHEGLSGARRSVQTAADNERKFEGEIAAHRAQSGQWVEEARRALAAGNEDEARLALVRKQEVEDLVAGLEQQLAAAVAAREHLTTTLRALEARIAEAQRKRETLLRQKEPTTPGETSAAGSTRAAAQAALFAPLSADEERKRKIDAELERLRRELGEGSRG